MAVIDTSGWTARTGITPTGADATSIAQYCTDVSAILTRKCYPVALEPKPLTLFACDAPPSEWLTLPLRPCRAITALYYHAGANGDSSVLDLTADLLVAGTDYLLPIDDALNAWNRAGKVFRCNTSAWGTRYRRPVGKLGYALEAERGSVFVSGTFGPASGVIDGAAAAGAAAVTLMYQRRTTGAPLQSESWGGYSYSAAAPFTAEAAVNSPEVLGILRDSGLLPLHVA